MDTALAPLAPARTEVPAMAPTTLDYLARAGDAFVATLALYSTRPSPAEHQRAGRLADLAWRCAERARAVATRAGDIDRALATVDLADKAHLLATALGSQLTAASAGEVA